MEFDDRKNRRVCNQQSDLIKSIHSQVERIKKDYNRIKTSKTIFNLLEDLDLIKKVLSNYFCSNCLPKLASIPTDDDYDNLLRADSRFAAEYAVSCDEVQTYARTSGYSVYNF